MIHLHVESEKASRSPVSIPVGSSAAVAFSLMVAFRNDALAAARPRGP